MGFVTIFRHGGDKKRKKARCCHAEKSLYEIPKKEEKLVVEVSIKRYGIACLVYHLSAISEGFLFSYSYFTNFRYLFKM